MNPFVVNGQVWQVETVEPGDPMLVDRTGMERLATTDSVAHKVRISSAVEPPLLDRVALHEAAHVVSIAHGTLQPLRAMLPERLWVPVEEWAAREVEANGIEAAELASRMLGRPVCVNGLCHGQH